MGIFLRNEKGNEMRPKKTFAEWKNEVEKELVKLCGFESDFLPDFDFCKDYENKIAPMRTAKRIIAWAKTF